MSDRLAAALSRSYRLERELGQACPERTRGGGMATVSLAPDLKPDRQAGITVLEPRQRGLPGVPSEHGR